MHKKIILASRSIARRRLLKQLGLRFRVAESQEKEGHRLPKSGCKDLVIKNALKKAKDIAGRYRSGIIIGADTVVLSGRRIIVKPKDIKDARKTLRLLSEKPQWVYTGLAVIDIDGRKIFTDYEKTKIYMCRLGESEIEGYFRKISPLDKAGSFDIQGIGGLFIDRIEGCFYNVVGLPLAKLRKMLMKAGLDIFQESIS